MKYSHCHLFVATWLFLSISVNGGGLQICMQQNRAFCLGFQGGSGGLYIENLLNCKMMKTENAFLKISTKAGASSQSWILEEFGGAAWYDEKFFRFYNKAMVARTQAFVLDATNNNLRMNPRVENAGQKFVLVEPTDDVETACPEPSIDNILPLSVGGGNTNPNCGRRKVWSMGRCVRVFR